mmetsp:Transcript_79821/g.171076  ORF Transcript_79821/g.171076 Transcript_79821/m.171076 type:complete len:152 (-) Transcript_79821:107-562(-)
MAVPSQQTASTEGTDGRLTSKQLKIFCDAGEGQKDCSANCDGSWGRTLTRLTTASSTTVDHELRFAAQASDDMSVDGLGGEEWDEMLTSLDGFDEASCSGVETMGTASLLRPRPPKPVTDVLDELASDPHQVSGRSMRASSPPRLLGSPSD